MMERGDVDWLESLSAERAMLLELGQLAESSRAASLGGSGGLEEILARQSELCRRLEALRDVRRAFLADSGAAATDFLPAVLARTAHERHAEVISAFRAYVDAAQAAQHQIDLNKDFFRVALAAVEGTLSSVSGDLPATYAPAPGGSATPQPLVLNVAC